MDNLFALFTGRSGSGKSVAAASMPKPFEELDFDLRANGIKDAIEQGWLDGNGITFTPFDPFGGVLQIEKYLSLQRVMVSTRQFNKATMDVGSLTSLIRLLDLTSLNTSKDQGGMGHLNIAGMAMTGAADYKFESQVCHRIFDYLRMLPCHITVSAHIIDKWGRDPKAKDDYAPQVPIGEKLTVTGNLGENILAMFTNVFRFSKEILGNEAKYFVEFNTDMAKNNYGIPPGKFDITKKPFWEFFQQLVSSIKDGTFKRKINEVNSGVFTL